MTLALAIVYTVNATTTNIIRCCLLTLFHSFFFSDLNCFITTWCNYNLTFPKNLRRYRNKMVRIILIYFRNFQSNGDICKKHKMLKLQDMCNNTLNFEVCCFVYKFFFLNFQPVLKVLKFKRSGALV